MLLLELLDVDVLTLRLPELLGEVVMVRPALLELRVGFVTGVRVPTEPAEPALTLRVALVLLEDVVPVLREALLSSVTVRVALVLLGRLYVDVDCVERVACVA